MRLGSSLPGCYFSSRAQLLALRFPFVSETSEKLILLLIGNERVANEFEQEAESADYSLAAFAKVVTDFTWLMRRLTICQCSLPRQPRVSSRPELRLVSSFEIRWLNSSASQSLFLIFFAIRAFLLSSFLIRV